MPKPGPPDPCTPLVRGENQVGFFGCSWETCFWKNVTSEEISIAAMPWNAFFSVALWCIWKNQNEGVFFGVSKTLSAPSLTQAIKIKADLWFRAWNTPSQIIWRANVPPNCVDTQVGWKKPPVGWQKMNDDGAADQNQGLAGTGGEFLEMETVRGWAGLFLAWVLAQPPWLSFGLSIMDSEWLGT
ncbi:unnamed protein product [Linum trigynum]|uniref:Uncharacterized protein n=1 Tax=Linum trigynum TaxID=586398 RepID=A0AAV2GSK8_9ROSI